MAVKKRRCGEREKKVVRIENETMILITIDQLMNSAKSNYFPICICDRLHACNEREARDGLRWRDRERPNACAYSNLMCMIVLVLLSFLVRYDCSWAHCCIRRSRTKTIAIIFIIPICSIVRCARNGQNCESVRICAERIRLNCAYLFKIVASMSVFVDMPGFQSVHSIVFTSFARAFARSQHTAFE